MWMAFSKVCKKLCLGCLTVLSRGFNTPIELRNLFTSVFVWDSLNILIISNLNVLNILLKIKNNSLKHFTAAILYIAAQKSENYDTKGKLLIYTTNLEKLCLQKHQRCSIKKEVLKNFTNLQENTCICVFFKKFWKGSDIGVFLLVLRNF